MYSDSDTFVFGALDSEGRLLQFQRHFASKGEPPYFEIYDYVVGGFGVVSKCVFNGSSLRIYLNSPQDKYDKIETNLSSASYEKNKVKEDLLIIFRGYENVLEIEEYA